MTVATLAHALREIATLAKWELIAAGPPAKVTLTKVTDAPRTNSIRIRGPRDYR